MKIDTYAYNNNKNNELNSSNKNISLVNSLFTFLYLISSQSYTNKVAYTILFIFQTLIIISYTIKLKFIRYWNINTSLYSNLIKYLSLSNNESISLDTYYIIYNCFIGIILLYSLLIISLITIIHYSSILENFKKINSIKRYYSLKFNKFLLKFIFYFSFIMNYILYMPILEIFVSVYNKNQILKSEVVKHIKQESLNINSDYDTIYYNYYYKLITYQIASFFLITITILINQLSLYFDYSPIESKLYNGVKFSIKSDSLFNLILVFVVINSTFVQEEYAIFEAVFNFILINIICYLSIKRKFCYSLYIQFVSTYQKFLILFSYFTIIASYIFIQSNFINAYFLFFIGIIVSFLYVLVITTSKFIINKAYFKASFNYSKNLKEEVIIFNRIVSKYLKGRKTETFNKSNTNNNNNNNNISNNQLKIDNNSKNHEIEAILEMYMIYHKDFCLEEHCYIKKFSFDDNYNKQYDNLIKYTIELYLKALTDSPKDIDLIICYVLFCNEFKTNVNHANRLLNILNNISYSSNLKISFINNNTNSSYNQEYHKNYTNITYISLYYSYLIFYTSKYFSIGDTYSNSNEYNLIDANEYDEFSNNLSIVNKSNLFDILTSTIENITKHYIDLYSLLGNSLFENLSISKVFNLSQQIDNETFKMKDLWNILSKEKINSNQKLLIELFQEFVNEVLHDDKLKNEISYYLNNECTNLIDESGDYFDLKNLDNFLETQDMVAFARSNDKGECNILKVSNTFAAVLGYNKSELVNKPVENIIPNMFRLYYSNMLAKQISYLNNRNINQNSKDHLNKFNKNEYSFFALTKSKFIVPAKSTTCIKRDEEVSTSYIIKVKFERFDSKQDFSYHIIVDSNMIIQNISSSCILLGLDNNLVSQQQINILKLIKLISNETNDSNCNINNYKTYHSMYDQFKEYISNTNFDLKIDAFRKQQEYISNFIKLYLCKHDNSSKSNSKSSMSYNIVEFKTKNIESELKINKIKIANNANNINNINNVNNYDKYLLMTVKKQVFNLMNNLEMYHFIFKDIDNNNNYSKIITPDFNNKKTNENINENNISKTIDFKKLNYNKLEYVNISPTSNSFKCIKLSTIKNSKVLLNTKPYNKIIIQYDLNNLMFKINTCTTNENSKLLFNTKPNLIKRIIEKKRKNIEHKESLNNLIKNNSSILNNICSNNNNNKESLNNTSIRINENSKILNKSINNQLSSSDYTSEDESNSSASKEIILTNKLFEIFSVQSCYKIKSNLLNLKSYASDVILYKRDQKLELVEEFHSREDKLIETINNFVTNFNNAVRNEIKYIDDNEDFNTKSNMINNKSNNINISSILPSTKKINIMKYKSNQNTKDIIKFLYNFENNKLFLKSIYILSFIVGCSMASLIFYNVLSFSKSNLNKVLGNLYGFNFLFYSIYSEYLFLRLLLLKDMSSILSYKINFSDNNPDDLSPNNIKNIINNFKYKYEIYKINFYLINEDLNYNNSVEINNLINKIINDKKQMLKDLYNEFSNSFYEFKKRMDLNSNFIDNELNIRLIKFNFTIDNSNYTKFLYNEIEYLFNNTYNNDIINNNSSFSVYNMSYSNTDIFDYYTKLINIYYNIVNNFDNLDQILNSTDSLLYIYNTLNNPYADTLNYLQNVFEDIGNTIQHKDTRMIIIYSTLFICLVFIIIIQILYSIIVKKKEKMLTVLLTINKNVYNKLKHNSEEYLNKLLHNVYIKTSYKSSSDSKIIVKENDFNIEKCKINLNSI